MFLKLTNAGSQGAPVYIKAESITMVGIDGDGDTLIVYDGRNEFVTERPEEVLEMIKKATGGGVLK